MTVWRARWIPAAAAAATVLIGVVMFLLLRGAAENGVDALEQSLQSEVAATARSQDAAIRNGLTGVAGFARDTEDRRWEFELESDADGRVLNDLLALAAGAAAELRTGFFLTDADLRITQGANLEDDAIIGTTFERQGLDEYARSGALADGQPTYLPIQEGLTAPLPVTTVVVPVVDETTRELRGTFVFESEVSVESTLNSELSTLGRGDTGEYLFYDTRGTVVAASDPTLLAEPVPDERFLTSPAGVTGWEGDIVVVADVPSAGWRVAFRQDRDEFESDLADPLQTAGSVIVVAFVVLAGVAFIALARRLRAAREEQERLRRLHESQEEFISIVSHELRTPVAGVLGFLQTSLDHWDVMPDEARHSAMVRAASNARRLQSLTRDVLDAESAEAGRMAYSMDAGDLAEEVRVAVDAATALHPDHTFELRIDEDAVPVRADVDRLQQVFANLLDNAAQVAPPSTPIEISLAVDRAAAEPQAVVSVVDHGPGLAPDARERIFEKFSRGQSGAVAGTGLGLYIARQIVGAHGGTMRVESEPGAGATFVVSLPLASADAESV